LNKLQYDEEKILLTRLENLLEIFKENEIRISLAESCTGGYISHMITNIPGASEILDRGVVTYSNQSKVDLLSIDSALIEKFGAVSEVVAKQMAEAVRRISQAEIGIGVTGIAGPTGGTLLKPVGTVFIAISFKGRLTSMKFVFRTTRIGFKKKVLESVISMLEEIVETI